MGLGDQIAQNFIETDSKGVDFVRTMQFTGIGFFISVSIYTGLVQLIMLHAALAISPSTLEGER